MKVSELIEELKKYPQDMMVVTYGGEEINVRTFKEYPLGDSANPNCEYQEVVFLE